MTATPQHLARLLDLEQIEVDLFRGRQPQVETQRVFGGQVAAQALMAAGRTVAPGRFVHSLHAYFVLAGDPTVPIVYDVDPIRDGGSFSTRRVIARQHGRTIFAMSASFQVREEGLTHQIVMPRVPDPEGLPPLPRSIEGGLVDAGDARSAVRVISMREEWGGLDLRAVGASGPPRSDRAAAAGESLFWFRVTEQLPDDPLLHTCLLAYVSDILLLHSALLSHPGTVSEQLMVWSLDHAMWFHAPARADGWILYDTGSSWAGGARGLTDGRMFRTDGQQAATIVQEGLIRPIDPRPSVGSPPRSR